MPAVHLVILAEKTVGFVLIFVKNIDPVLIFVIIVVQVNLNVTS